MSPDTFPTQIAEIRKDVEYLRREHDRECQARREDEADNKEFRREVRERLLRLENASVGLAAVAGSNETRRTRFTWMAALAFGLSGMVVGILSVVLR